MLSLESYIWLAWRATMEWMGIIRRLETRVPLIILLVPSATWANAINKGNGMKLGAQEALRALASLQMKERIWFKAESWENWGNLVPSEWGRSIRFEKRTTNVCQIGSSLMNWMNLPLCSLCRRCATQLDRLTRVGGARGLNVQWPLGVQHGYTCNQKTSKHWQLSDTFPTSSRSRKTVGQLSRDIYQRCDGCTELINTLNWSRSTPCLPWWVLGANDGVRNHNRGNQ